MRQRGASNTPPVTAIAKTQRRNARMVRANMSGVILPKPGDGMPIWEAVLLGIIQGLTEFLPISSTAHMLVVRKP